MKLVSKLIITGQIEALTGLHIGGSKSSMDIGGVDLNVIKNHNGIPFIPGSSLKGKLRSLLARIEGSMAVSPDRRGRANNVKTDQDVPYIQSIFGMAGDETDDNADQEISRLIVRDALLIAEESPNQDEFDEMDFQFTDVKFENTIDRKKGVAQHPRQLERVPPGAQFTFEMIFDIYSKDEENTYESEEQEELKNEVERTARDHYLYALGIAMELLQDDYLGGQGTRGYGKVAFRNVEVKQKRMTNYRYALADLDDELNAFADQLKALS
ncbi:MAG: type III-A CRISPR-associated RAMP protein Csm3 [Bacteroidota bacterium]